MLSHQCKGVHIRYTHEIMRPYGCITSIRFNGYDLSHEAMAPLQIIFSLQS